MGINKRGKTASKVCSPSSYSSVSSGESQTEHKARIDKNNGEDIFCKLNVSVVEARITHLTGGSGNARICVHKAIAI